MRPSPPRGSHRPRTSPSFRSRSGTGPGGHGPGRSGRPPGRWWSRAPVGADLAGHEPPGEQRRVVHQVAAHLVAAVGQAGQEQQPGVLDGVRGEDDQVRVHPVGRAAGQVLHPGGAPGHRVGEHPGHHGPGAQFDAGRPAGLGAQRRVLGTGRADRDAAGAARAGLAEAVAGPGGQAVAGVRGAGDGEPGGAGHGGVADGPAVEGVGEPAVEVAGRDGPHGEGVVVRDRQSDGAALLPGVGGDAEFVFGCAVVRLQVVVADRPVAAAAEVAGAEVLRVHARGEAGPEQSGAAVGTQVTAGVGQRAVLPEVSGGGEATAGEPGEVGDVEGRGVGVVRVGRGGRAAAGRAEGGGGLGPGGRGPAGFEDEDPPALRAEAVGDQRSGEACADHDDVPAGGHRSSTPRGPRPSCRGRGRRRRAGRRGRSARPGPGRRRGRSWGSRPARRRRTRGGPGRGRRGPGGPGWCGGVRAPCRWRAARARRSRSVRRTRAGTRRSRRGRRAPRTRRGSQWQDGRLARTSGHPHGRRRWPRHDRPWGG